MKDYVTVIGGGLAGSEAALQIAKNKIKVKLYEMKPVKFSPAHSNKNLAEIVCSNSFKSNLLTNACGLLKEELRRLGSYLIPIADIVKVPAGQALAVDRDEFAKEVTKKIKENEYIEIVLNGNRNFEINVYEILKLISNDRIIKIKDKTKIGYDLDKLSNDTTLRGLFVKELKEKLNDNTNEEEKEIIEKAIEIGLNVLE